MVIIKSKNTEIILEEKGYKRKLQPKVEIQKYDHPKEEILIGSKKEMLEINKVLKIVKQKQPNRNNYKVTILNKINMAPEICLDVFIIDNQYEKSQEIQTIPEVKQRELGEFNQ